MDNYLIDRETLGQFIDELIKKKALPVDNEEELSKLREEKIKELDDKIGMAIFGSLTKEQNEEIRQLMDQNVAAEQYDEFFEKYHIDEDKIITDALESFAKEFLGGQNE